MPNDAVVHPERYVWHVCTDEELFPDEDEEGTIHFSEDATSLPTGWLGQ